MNLLQTNLAKVPGNLEEQHNLRHGTISERSVTRK